MKVILDKRILKSQFLLALIISIFSYFVFFYPLLSPTTTTLGIGSKDSRSMHYPFRFYLSEKLKEGVFPFWTERLHSGFPLYADLEKGYLSPINIVSVIIFGPVFSYSIIHFLFYISGSMGLYLLLKRKGFTLLGFSVSNFIFYFSFFHLYREQLFNTVLVTYLIPLTLYYLDKYLENKQRKYLLLNVLSISAALEFGQINFVFILLLFQFIYATILVFKIWDIKRILLSLAEFSVLMLVFNLPILLPAAELFTSSARSSGSVSFTDGSFTPEMSLNIIYPYLFGTPSNYVGKIIDNEYLINEIYVYVGITSFITAIIGFLLMKNSRFKVILLVNVGVFLVLGYVKYIPLLNTLELPPFSLFRYWMRSVVFLLFAVSVFSGFFISNLEGKLHFSKLNKITLGIPVVYLLLLFVVNFNSFTTQTTIKHFLNGGFDFGCYFVFWMLLVISVPVLIFLRFKYKNKTIIINKLLVTLIFLDLIVFGFRETRASFGNANDLIPFSISKDLVNKRTIFLDEKDVYGNIPIYFNSWGLFGYSGPFESKDFGDYLKTKGFDSSRRPKIYSNPGQLDPLFVNDMKSLGVVGILPKSGEVYFIQDPQNTELIVGDGLRDTRYISKDEGHIAFATSAAIKTEITVLLRNYPGWNLFIDNKPSSFTSNSSDIYLKLLLEPGEHIVDIKYVPNAFYTGLLASLWICIGYFAVLKFKKII